MTWTHWVRLGPDLRAMAVHRVSDDTAAAETWVGGEWTPVPGHFLERADSDPMIEQVTEAEAAAAIAAL